MNVIEIIEKKKKKLELTKEEIDYLINNYVDEKIPDYQMSAFCMAVWFNGFSDNELKHWTYAMLKSGDQIDLHGIEGIKVDKHSTGGVADTTSLVALPLAVACGCKVAKMSGRGLGHTGGTLDKLESIPNFKINLTQEEFCENVKKCGLSIIGQTAKITPADKKLYALRDVTATVDSIPLICSSIMSKKLASGSDVIVLDVKFGNGSFMKKYEDAKILAKKMVEIGKDAGKKICAIISDMNQPLGNAIGNSLEVKEAIEILSGNVNSDLKKLSVIIAAKLVELSGITKNLEDAIALVEQKLKSGEGKKVLKQFILLQGGNENVVDDTSLLPQVKKIIKIESKRFGYITSFDTEKIGHVAMLLGAGREKIEDKIDPAVGIVLKKRLNSKITEDDKLLAEFYVNDEKNLDDAIELFYNAITITEKNKISFNLVYSVV